MDNTLQPEASMQNEGVNFGLKTKIGEALGLKPLEIDLQNADAFVNRKDEKDPRFLYGFTEPSVQSLAGTSLKPGFLKYAEGSETTTRLKHESQGTEIAQKIGIPTVPILRRFQEISKGQGLILLERLRAKDGVSLATQELLAAADPEFGARAAKALRAAIGRLIPHNIDNSFLKKDDGRNQSLETFLKVWEEQNSKVFEETNIGLVDSLIGNEVLREIVNKTRATIEPLIKKAENPNDEYFVHNDTAPNNMFFKNTGEVLFLDFEHAGATHNLFLAQLTDLGNYYGRMWANPEMQKQFLLTYLSESSPDNLDYNYQLLRGTAIFGSMYLAKYGMETNHPEHAMSRSLLNSLESNLTKLDEKYNELKARNFTPLEVETIK